ncbi:MAG: YigZ family protein, partial [Gemmatimonadetes bacterium]|nr:YigZ family protein [Gemmatimonadota bacterium]
MPEPRGYPIPAGPHRVEDVVQRSRFIATVGHAPTADAARAFIDAVRRELPDAAHNWWAYVA